MTHKKDETKEIIEKASQQSQGGGGGASGGGVAADSNKGSGTPPGNPGEGMQMVDESVEFDPSGGVGDGPSFSGVGQEQTLSLSHHGAPPPFTEYSQLGPLQSPRDKSGTEGGPDASESAPDYDPSGAGQRADAPQGSEQDARRPTGPVDKIENWNPDRFGDGGRSGNDFGSGGG